MCMDLLMLLGCVGQSQSLEAFRKIWSRIARMQCLVLPMYWNHPRIWECQSHGAIMMQAERETLDCLSAEYLP